eukprot:COSAG01_NODE_63460_length_280_cov_0.491713_1_plen_64_part_01
MIKVLMFEMMEKSMCTIQVVLSIPAAARWGQQHKGRTMAAPFFKQKTAYGILRSDWSSDVCSSD